VRITIREAARRAGLAPGTLRALDRKGLLTPRRDWNGRRVYTSEDIARLRSLAGLGPEAGPAQ
jgi:DNA-binding transcriptional MerR regulator